MVRILVVDDSAAYRAHVRASVEMSGERAVVVGEAVNGHEALAFLNREEVDLMILDLEMPELGGLAVLADVTKTHPSLPVVVVSSLAGSHDGIKALHMGAKYSIPKRELDETSLGRALKTIIGVAEPRP